MRITHLSLTNFRAFTRLDIEFPRRILLLIGDNAQGKTSLLEAIFYLATFSSFHTQTDRQLVSFHTGGESLAVARIVAEIEKSEIHQARGSPDPGECNEWLPKIAQRDPGGWYSTKNS